MIKTKVLLFGGLGNILFQVSRALEHERQGRTVEVIKIGAIKNILYKLSNFTIHDMWLDEEIILQDLNIKHRNANFLEIALIGLCFILRRFHLYPFFDMPINDNRLNNSKNILLYLDIGYFQNIKNVSKKTLKLVAVSLNKLLKNQANNIPSFSFAFHIRGGDFTDNMRLSQSDISKAEDFATINNLAITFITNDKIYANKLMANISNASHFNGNSAREDFIALCKAKNLFISNSTFGFWSALCAKELFLEDLILPENFDLESLI